MSVKRVDNIWEIVTRDTEKCPLSVLTGVRIKRVNFREKIWAFCRDKRNCPYKTGVRIKRVSVERGSTVHPLTSALFHVHWTFIGKRAKNVNKDNVVNEDELLHNETAKLELFPQHGLHFLSIYLAGFFQGAFNWPTNLNWKLFMNKKFQSRFQIV